MMSTTSCAALAASLMISIFIAPGSASTGVHFRGAVGSASARSVTTQELRMSLQDSMETMVRGGDGAMARRQARIEASLWHTFQAVPKNEMGRLAPRAVRYIVHNYFAKEHGWLMKGLEPHNMQSNITEMHELSILQDKAPALVETLLETRQSDRGLSLEDCIVMIAVLETLIFDESITLLQASYNFNGQSQGSMLNEDAVHEILTSYLVTFEMGSRVDLTDAHSHQVMKERVAASGGSWENLLIFEQDIVKNFGYAQRHSTNPFSPQQYSFEDVSRIVEHMADDYGKWQNSECRQMKQQLMELAPDDSGRVPLSKFYSQPDTADYQFTESVEYLREIGALDETTSAEPRVLIPNYVMGPSNCIATSTYYSVCCLSDCENLMNELEGKILAPATTVEKMLEVVANLSSPSVDAPRQISLALQERLHTIASHHSGKIPLHGRFFAQWMHHAFPNECPNPHIAEDSAVLTPGHWTSSKATLSAQERQEYAEATKIEEVSEPYVLQWSDEEMLPLHEPGMRSNWWVSFMRTFMKLAAMIFVVVHVCTKGLQMFRQLVPNSKKTDDGFILPM